ncbi:Predicted methyltransferase [Marinobacter sp. LV10R510-11A]|uniref:class I SAM-dependent methyltransferase n=1 Tax=Marinobacter sp. LV10R510-11A TaxID=1415568 RepID=UPI000BC00245|nr:class I SAM-dependent methyltransferase [Marinobacter sp. LV10R510-11A]SOB75415.1 Predicted methyltransferase [Marinobacter sp. LV10R510-11A]
MLIAPQWIKSVSWSEATVSIDLIRQAVKDAPPYYSTAQLDRTQAMGIHEHYGHPGYWTTQVMHCTFLETIAKKGISMMNIKASVVFSSILLMFSTSVLADLPASNQAQLRAAIEGNQRSKVHQARDQYRHPLQTLSFFGVTPSMRVIEVLPGGGWYTEILAPYLHDQGQLIEASFPEISDNPFFRKMANRFQHKLDGAPEIYGRVHLEPFSPPEYLALGAPNSADRVLTFRSVHDLVFVNPHGEPTSAVIQQFFGSAYQVLKPGGVLGVVAHRAAPDMPVGESDKMGRLPQSYVIEQARRAGFTLAASSEINANPKDDHKLPVWYLPPSLKQGDRNRARYQMIGEADNMTLKFVKPAEPDSP